MNLIPYNTIDDLGFKRPSQKRAIALAKSLHSRHILTKLRNSAGQDIDGGCGQLRARSAVPKEKKSVPLNFSARQPTAKVPADKDGIGN
jgi:23S rRNA (adenine2503-C2)-methyltransferase